MLAVQLRAQHIHPEITGARRTGNYQDVRDRGVGPQRARGGCCFVMSFITASRRQKDNVINSAKGV